MLPPLETPSPRGTADRRILSSLNVAQTARLRQATYTPTSENSKRQSRSRPDPVNPPRSPKKSLPTKILKRPAKAFGQDWVCSKDSLSKVPTKRTPIDNVGDQVVDDRSLKVVPQKLFIDNRPVHSAVARATPQKTTLRKELQDNSNNSNNSNCRLLVSRLSKKEWQKEEPCMLTVAAIDALNTRGSVLHSELPLRPQEEVSNTHPSYRMHSYGALGLHHNPSREMEYKQLNICLVAVMKDEKMKTGKANDRIKDGHLAMVSEKDRFLDMDTRKAGLCRRRTSHIILPIADHSIEKLTWWSLALTTQNDCERATLCDTTMKSNEQDTKKAFSQKWYDVPAGQSILARAVAKHKERHSLPLQARRASIVAAPQDTGIGLSEHQLALLSTMVLPNAEQERSPNSGSVANAALCPKSLADSGIGGTGAATAGKWHCGRDQLDGRGSESGSTIDYLMCSSPTYTPPHQRTTSNASESVSDVERALEPIRHSRVHSPASER